MCWQKKFWEMKRMGIMQQIWQEFLATMADCTTTMGGGDRPLTDVGGGSMVGSGGAYTVVEVDDGTMASGDEDGAGDGLDNSDVA
jgi:hypothetical protein